MTTTLFILILLVILGITTIGVYNRIIATANAAQRAWADVLAYERQKTKTLEALTEQADAFKEHEHHLMTELTQLRESIAALPESPNGGTLKPVETMSQQVVDRVKLAVEAYPELRSSNVVTGFMREISEQQANVGAAINVFNSEVERFNNSIQFFLAAQVNNLMLHKERIVPFSDSEAASGFEYQPNF
ncbi:LemA family protein [Pseudomonas neustonica]|uniref:LemA family protein n=1 Tax=Pseudomonas neustonica TaxID=2487346 RepID=UPI003C82E356|tara:strand:+ start:2366 stop:2932 length:567 start_codon:yes stop_codon:yes gene_type:complete